MRIHATAAPVVGDPQALVDRFAGAMADLRAITKVCPIFCSDAAVVVAKCQRVIFWAVVVQAVWVGRLAAAMLPSWYQHVSSRISTRSLSPVGESQLLQMFIAVCNSPPFVSFLGTDRAADIATVLRRMERVYRFPLWLEDNPPPLVSRARLRVSAPADGLDRSPRASSASALSALSSSSSSPSSSPVHVSDLSSASDSEAEWIWGDDFPGSTVARTAARMLVEGGFGPLSPSARQVCDGCSCDEG